MLTGLLFLLNKSAVSQFYHGMHHPFGQNRMQYEQFDWMKYEFEHFTVFFYGESKNLAIYTARNANEMIEEMEQFFDYSLKRNRTQFVVYQKLEHFRQSNVGIPETDESNIGGTTQIAGSKIFVYFDGDLNSFRNQIREGITQVLIGQMLFGDNWREMIKNNALMNFPTWFTQGLTKYAANPWDVHADDRLRDLISRDKYANFNRLKGVDAEVAGRSLWYYIGETYGTNVIPNILYMARVTRSIESGFLFVLGISLNTLLEDAERFFEHRYMSDENGSQAFNEFEPVKTSKAMDYTEPVLSDDGRYLAYASNKLSKIKVHVYDNEREKRKKLMRQGHKLDRIYELDYPIMDWNPVSGELFVIAEKKGEIWMHRFDPKEGRVGKTKLLRLEKVLEMEFSDDGKQILFSAINKGQTDIYLYSVAANSQRQLTDDIYDDRYPAFWQQNQVIFASNRANDTVNLAKDYLMFQPSKQMDLYKLQMNSDVAMNLTSDEVSNEVRPTQLNATEYMFLSDASGIVNRNKGYIDSTIVSVDTVITYRYFSKNEPLTAYKRNVHDYDYNRAEQKLIELVYQDGKYKFHEKSGDDITKAFVPVKSNFVQDRILSEQNQAPVPDSIPTPFDSLGIKFVKKQVFPETNLPDSKSSGEIDIHNYTFEEEALKEVAEPEAKTPDQQANDQLTDSLSQTPVEKIITVPEMRNYNIAFAATDLTTQFDFDYATDLYQPFNGGPYIMPGMGTFVKVGMLDVFEDYKVEGGFRYSFNNSGTEYFISLEDRSKRLDKKYIIQRQSLITSQTLQRTQRTQLYQARGIFRYPLDPVQSIQLTSTGRYDRLITLGTDRGGLQESDATVFWAGLKLEYIFDNTLNKSLNILNGSRVKVFAEHYRNVIDPSTSLYVTGLDARNYIPIHRDLIWANRLAASSSFGPQKLVYYLGSVDNWIVLGDRVRFDNSNAISPNQGYAFQTIATNMRGFPQNARNGNNFAVFNSELRWPIVRYFTNKPLKSEFLSTLQVIGFGDVGTAWTGRTPYSEENSFNRITETNGSITVIYENQTEPVVGGVGWGLRAKVWGYFVRFDYAWGIENGLFLPPTTHLSFGLDF